MLKGVTIFSGFLIFINLQVYGQKDSLPINIQLSPVSILSQRLNYFSAGSKITNIDSSVLRQFQHQNLGDLLGNESPIFIKSYGLGSLATSSFRGASSSQTAVLWNGFNLNSSMNGVLDFSLIPVDFVDEVNIQFGGAGALWGSSAVGGAIHLNHSALFNQGSKFKVNFSGGSFGQFQQNIGIEISKKKWVGSIKFLNNSAQNNFPFVNVYLPDSPIVKQNHAKFLSQGMLLENHFLIRKNQRLNLLVWYQNTQRQIPPTIFQNSSLAEQNDKALRISSQWNRFGKTINYTARVAYFNESILYSDIASNILSNNRSQNYIGEVESKIQLKKQHQLNIGLNNTFLMANVDAYLGIAYQNRTALFASYAFVSKSKKTTISVSGRQEMVDKKMIPTTYSSGINWQIFPKLTLLSNVSKVYRLPTFNDKYWSPGGNPNLLPESGFSEEIGLKFNSLLLNQKANFLIEITVFNRNMENCIVWLPAENGGSYWTPQNILQVWSRGLESKSQLSYQFGKVKSILGISTNYVVSTNEKAKSENDASIGKQLLYVPMYSGQGKITLEYKKFTFTYRHNYTGYRYTASDNTEFLSPYFLGSVYSSYNRDLKKTNASIFVQINNVWGVKYQLIEARPMPLTNFNVGINLTSKTITN